MVAALGLVRSFVLLLFALPVAIHGYHRPSIVILSPSFAKTS